MVSQTILEKYAELSVVVGVNIQPGQTLLIRCAVDDAFFARLCAKRAYELGAKKVIMDWSDDTLSLLNYTFCSEEVLKQVSPSRVMKFDEVVEEEAAVLNIIAPTPGLLAEIDPAKVASVSQALGSKIVKYREYTMGNRGQWTIVALPSAAWATKVFPDVSEEEAIEMLWNAILASVRVSESNNPVEEWAHHNAMLSQHNAILNNYNFKSLIFKNSLGTDVEIGLVADHIWAGGMEHSTKGIEFNPNMPTEESFTMPSTTHVNGKIVASKPLSYNGHIIDDFWIEFKNGRAENWDAKTGLSILTSLLETDEGSKHLGEVALISHQSPISDSGILFYNTLFDENASCHVALGRAYPMNVKGGVEMSPEELSAAGANDSLNHVDFMFGNSDMSIKGVRQDGELVTVFENGNFVF